MFNELKQVIAILSKYNATGLLYCRDGELWLPGPTVEEVSEEDFAALDKLSCCYLHSNRVWAFFPPTTVAETVHCVPPSEWVSGAVTSNTPVDENVG